MHAKGKLKPYVTALVKVAKAFRERGIDFVLIGSLILPLAYGIDWDVHDIDLFILNKSTLMDSELFEELARDMDWDVGESSFGGMYYEVVVGGDVVKVDLMENMLDVYVPEGILKDSIEVNVDGERIRVIRIEGLIVLKAREATDEARDFLENLSTILADPRSRVEVDAGRILRYIEEFPEDERQGIRHRIEVSGIYLE